LCEQAIEYFKTALSAVSGEMHPLMGQDKRGMSHEKKLEQFVARETRTQLVGLIRKAQESERKAQVVIEKIIRLLDEAN